MVKYQMKGAMSVDNSFEFEREFTTDEEVEAMIEGLLNFIGEQVEEEDNKNAVINPKKAQMVLSTYKLLKYLTKGSGAKVTYALNEPYKSMGSVSVVGKNLIFDNAEWFMAAVKMSSNFNVYPKTNGTVQMDFTFHGLTIPLE